MLNPTLSALHAAVPNERTLDEVLAVIGEYVKARQKHRPMRGPHEGYAVILEELDELWGEIKGNNPGRARHEVIQVAAMALAYLVEVAPRG